MPDLSIPNNAIPIRCPPGTRARADIKTRQVMNPHFWPEDIPLPDQEEFHFPHISLITKGFSLTRKRAFDPFHYGNTFLIRTIAWLISIDFLSVDDLTVDDRKDLDEYHRSPDARFIWSLADDDDLKTFKPTIEMRDAWLDKYKRRDAFFQRKKVHDLVRGKDKFLFDEKVKFAEKRLEDEGAHVELEKIKIKSFPYHYERDVLGGRLRRVRHPPVLERGKDPGALRRRWTKDDEICKILNFPPGHMPSQEEIEEAGGHMEWRALLLERYNLKSHPTDWVMPARRFWPIHTAERKRVLSVFPVPQTLPPSKDMLQDAPKSVVCWNRPNNWNCPTKAPSKSPMQSSANDKEQTAEKRVATQGEVATHANEDVNQKMVMDGKAAPMKEVAAQDNVPNNCTGSLMSTGSTVAGLPTSSSKDEDVVMTEAPAFSSSAAQEPQPSDADIIMGGPTEGQPRLVLREHNAQAAPPHVSDSAPTKKRKRDDISSEEDLPPAKRTPDSKPSASTLSKNASCLLQITPKASNQIPSPLGRPLHLRKVSPFPSPDDLIIPRASTQDDINDVVHKLYKLIPAQKLRACLRKMECDLLFCRIRSLFNVRGRMAYCRNPSRQERNDRKWRKRLMAEWRLVPSPLRSSVTLIRDEATGEYEFQQNHVEEAKQQKGEPGGTVVVAESEKNDNWGVREYLGVRLPDFWPHEPEVNWGWRLKGQSAIFTGMLPGGRFLRR